MPCGGAKRVAGMGSSHQRTYVFTEPGGDWAGELVFEHGLR